jgi:hypothetical protein
MKPAKEMTNEELLRAAREVLLAWKKQVGKSENADMLMTWIERAEHVERTRRN